MIFTEVENKVKIEPSVSQGVTISVKPSSVEEPKQSKKAKTKTAKKPKQTKIKITFVCTGNTCRSAMAEAIFADYIKRQKLSAKFVIKSCGLNVVEGEGMNPCAKAGIAYIDVPVPKHETKRFNSAEQKKDTLVVCMTASHKIATGLDNAYSIGEITRRGDVPDPYGHPIEEYVKVAKYLRQSIGEILTFAENLSKASKND
ncbi:MAG: hypothetical protein IKC64_03440 [Clostridia bacterium]|nr:hypothetical protein [Clostridia bacterium]